uniref:Uncharacterized protein n=1 Tax=Leptobrachium leishanense TaxID=445787 RepID=A0A8C5WII1_9ANUR
MERELGYRCALLISLTAAVSAQFQVHTKDKLVAEVGSNTILPCSLSPRLNPNELEVRWFRKLFHSVVFLLKNGQEDKEQVLADYRGRTSMPAGPQTGDLSLTLRDVQLSDAGMYHCFVENKSSQLYEEASTELSIVAVGFLPKLNLSLRDNSILVSFSSYGWFPEPEMRWEKVDGTNISAQTEESNKGTDGLFKVESSVLLEDVSDGNLYCSVRHPATGKDIGLYLNIAEDMFPRVSLWFYAFLVVLLLLLAAGIGAIIYVQRLHRERERLSGKVGRSSLELEWRTAVMKPDDICLSPETTHPQLSVSEDHRTLLNRPPAVTSTGNDLRFETERCSLGFPQFASGCHYWEVEVGEGVEWAVGVASPQVRKSGPAYQFSPREHIWCIARFVDVCQALDNDESQFQIAGGTLQRVGVYLKLSDPRAVSFYDIRSWGLLYKFSVPKTASEVRPFFWIGNRGGDIRLIKGREEEHEEREGAEDEHLL